MAITRRISYQWNTFDLAASFAACIALSGWSDQLLGMMGECAWAFREYEVTAVLPVLGMHPLTADGIPTK
jgi:hypothetical protein